MKEVEHDLELSHSTAQTVSYCKATHSELLLKLSPAWFALCSKHFQFEKLEAKTFLLQKIKCNCLLFSFLTSRMKKTYGVENSHSCVKHGIRRDGSDSDCPNIFVFTSTLDKEMYAFRHKKCFLLVFHQKAICIEEQLLIRLPLLFSCFHVRTASIMLMFALYFITFTYQSP